MSSLWLARILLPCLLVLVSAYTQQQATALGYQEVFLKSESYCGDDPDIHPETQYKVLLNLNKSCSPYDLDRKGFFCSITFRQQDPYVLVGFRLCVDLQGVAKTMPNTQLLIKAVNDNGDELKRIYTTTILRPENAPYYVCSSPTGKEISVSISVRDSVKLCVPAGESIMDSMVGRNISLGIFSMQRSVPVYELSRKDCFTHLFAAESIYMLKVAAEGLDSPCTLNVPAPPLYLHTRACISIVYISPDYQCDLSVELSDPFSDTEPLIRFPISHRTLFVESSMCNTYSSDGENQGEPVLKIQKEAYQSCEGTFALKASYTPDDSQENDGDIDSVSDMRHLYMAVFISLISVCLLILGLTCVCCLRMRSKRLLRTRRRNTNSSSAHNAGFDTTPNNLPAPSWHQSNPDQVFGLPTYEEIVSQDSEGVNPSQDPAKVDKPPTYDSLYPTFSAV